MCLLITLLAAVIATVAWYRLGLHGRPRAGRLCLLYWGAALMWLVDGCFRLAEGEAFLELSMHDALLGMTVVVLGLASGFLVRIHVRTG